MLFNRRYRTPHASAIGSGTGVAVAACAGMHLAGFSPHFPLLALLAFAGGAVPVVWIASRHGFANRFGAANHLTMVRGGLTMLVWAAVAERPSAPGAWFVVGLAVAAIVLDGVDGWLARRRQCSTEFGARFDMETDALLMLATAVLVWQHGKAGSWILASGLLRYAFVVAGWVAPWMKRQLPPSQRRRVVCVVQEVSLVASLMPALAPPRSDGIAMFGLVALIASFATDTAWLVRARREATGVAVES